MRALLYCFPWIFYCFFLEKNMDLNNSLLLLVRRLLRRIFPEHGPGGPILFFFRQIRLVSSSNIHHHQLGLVSKKALAP
jgi:hypothetical protein